MFEFEPIDEVIYKLLECLSDFILVAVGVELRLVLHEGRVADQVLHLGKATEYLHESCDGVSV